MKVSCHPRYQRVVGWFVTAYWLTLLTVTWRHDRLPTFDQLVARKEISLRPTFWNKRIKKTSVDRRLFDILSEDSHRKYIDTIIRVYHNKSYIYYRKNYHKSHRWHRWFRLIIISYLIRFLLGHLELKRKNYSYQLVMIIKNLHESLTTYAVLQYCLFQRAGQSTNIDLIRWKIQTCSSSVMS
jgi:hypothetical protein